MGLYWYVGGDYGFTPYNYVTCKNVMSIRIVMVTRGVMYDIGQSAPGGSPLIGAERRGFPRGRRVSWLGEPRRIDEVNDRICAITLREGL